MYFHIVHNRAQTKLVPLLLHVTAGTSNMLSQCSIIAWATCICRLMLLNVAHFFRQCTDCTLAPGLGVVTMWFSGQVLQVAVVRGLQPHVLEPLVVGGAPGFGTCSRTSIAV